MTATTEVMKLHPTPDLNSGSLVDTIEVERNARLAETANNSLRPLLKLMVGRRQMNEIQVLAKAAGWPYLFMSGADTESRWEFRGLPIYLVDDDNFLAVCRSVEVPK